MNTQYDNTIKFNAVILEKTILRKLDKVKKYYLYIQTKVVSRLTSLVTIGH